MTREEYENRFPGIVEVKAPDAVFRPNHYARYAIEPITFIVSNNLPFAVGNVVKYALRYDAKNGIEDCRKGIRYFEIIIAELERKARGESLRMPPV